MAGLLRLTAAMAGWRTPTYISATLRGAQVATAAVRSPVVASSSQWDLLCASSFSSVAAGEVGVGGTDGGTQPARAGFGKLAGRAPKGARKRKPRPTKKRVAVSAAAAGKVSAVELRALGKELGWDDEMIKNPDLLDILLVESARRQEDAARMKDTALFTALAGRLEVEFRTAKNLWNDTGGFGNKLSQFKPASAVRGPPPKSAKTLGAAVPQQGDPITVDLGIAETAAPGMQQHAGSGGDDNASR